MPHEENRKIIKVGQTSYAVILPKSWLRFHKLDNNDHVQVVSDGSVVIKPLKKSQGKVRRDVKLRLQRGSKK